MNISLTPTFERHIREKIDSGLYGNASEVVRAALRLMIETERKGAPGNAPRCRFRNTAR
ncbi:MAG: type II toxin-antitoxin system ParD family antitoxin [Rhodospirillales bacterium]